MADGCPDENTIARFAQDLLAADDRRALGEHIDGCSSCSLLMAELARVLPAPDALVSEPPPPVSESRPAAPAPASPAIEAGTRIGRYAVEKRIGSGGMGDVYLARDPTLGRRVALKLVRPPGTSGLGAAEGRERLIREARAMAQVAHPHVVSVYDAGAFGEQVFVAMEFVEGRTLAAWLDEAPRSWGEIVAHFAEAGLGLAAAHRRGVLHRDVKPSNLLVGDDGRIRVTDFGLARAWAVDADRDDEEAGDLTRAGSILGTPAFMSPEQLWGSDVDARSDQFGFCAALYASLFGERPFRGRTIDELRASTSHAEAPWPASTRGVPDAVVHVVLRGLASAPGRRYPTMTALVTDLRQAATQGAEGHVRLNAVLQAIAGPMHVAASVYMFGSIGNPRPVDGEPGILPGLFIVVYLFVVLGWLAFGILWAPMNAWGLWHHRRWARSSSLIYACLAIPSLIGAPYGIYALWSLTRPDVKATFR